MLDFFWLMYYLCGVIINSLILTAMVEVTFNRKSRRFVVHNSTIFDIPGISVDLQHNDYLFKVCSQAINFASLLARIYNTRLVVRYKSFPFSDGFALSCVVDSALSILKNRS